MAGKRKKTRRTGRAHRAAPPPPPTDALHSAAASNDIVALKRALEDGADVNALTEGKNATPLHHACFYGHYWAALVLLESGANPNALDYKNRTPLHHACHSRNRQLIQLCIRYGSDPRAADADGRTCDRVFSSKEKDLVTFFKQAVRPQSQKFGASDMKLLYGVETGNELKVIEKLDKARPVDVVSTDGNSALIIATRRGSKELVDLLCLHSADVNATDNNGNTALHWACIGGETEIVEILIDAFALLNSPNKTSLFTPMHLAASKGHADIVSILLERGGDHSRKDKDGQTPLHWACKNGRNSTIRLLVDVGAAVDDPDVYGVYPIHMAATAGTSKGVKCLLTRGGADINAATSSNRTALQTAVFNGDGAMTQLLLMHGARPSHSRKTGDTSLHICVKKMCDPSNDKDSVTAYEAVLRVLVHAFGDLNPRNRKQQTPLQCINVRKAFAAKSPQQRAALVLAKAGADVNALLQPPLSDDKRDLANLLRRHVMAESMDLPKGWKVKVTGTLRRRKYFVNKKERKTTWEDPRLDAVTSDAASAAAVGAPSSSMIMDHVTCPLCLELFYKPVTTACGHSYCQACLNEVLEYKHECPLCRQALVVPEEGLRLNTVLQDVIQSTFPEQYEARRMDAEM